MVKKHQSFLPFIELLHPLPIKVDSVKQAGSNSVCSDTVFRNSIGLRHFVDEMPGHRSGDVVQITESQIFPSILPPKNAATHSHGKSSQLFFFF